MEDLSVPCLVDSFYGMHLILWRFNLLFILA
jgi:hypothetical protein